MTQPPARRIARAQAAEASPEPTPGYGTSRLAAKTRRALLMSSSKTEAHCHAIRDYLEERKSRYRALVAFSAPAVDRVAAGWSPRDH